MELKMPIIKNYLATWHDGEHGGSCFDEDEFYIVHFTRPPPLSPISYLNFDSSFLYSNLIETSIR